MEEEGGEGSPLRRSEKGERKYHHLYSTRAERERKTKGGKGEGTQPPSHPALLPPFSFEREGGKGEG